MALFKRKSSATETQDVVKKTPGASRAKASKKTSTPVAPEKKAAKVTVRAHYVLLRPIVSEKSARLASDGVYVFEVRKSAGKVEIGQAIKELYGVIPSRVHVVNVPGKSVRFGRWSGERAGRKKAFVYLKKGETIEVFGA
ncbi:50S ribosomal protein L23 [Candidatus Uhrbacteria bacterium]|nr:50S ribosomal protein L23 [Candidatus Uhrbacteria bacterium]